jgi:hypothetical protein
LRALRANLAALAVLDPAVAPNTGKLHATGFPSQDVTLVLANGLSLLALSFVMFRLQAPVTLFRYDGTFILSIVKNQADWMLRLACSRWILKETGGLGFPIHTRLMPGLVIWTVSSDQRSAPLQVRKKCTLS